MPAIIKNNYRIHQARQFIESLSEGSPDDNFYLVIAEPDAWAGANEPFYTEGAPTDFVPPTPKDSAMSDFIIWDKFIAAKKITASDVSQVVRRINHWTDIDAEPQRPYPKYDSTKDDLISDDFYVIKVDGANTNCYKVIDNLHTENPTLTPDNTTAPAGETTGFFFTPDGYKWKYMYTITASQFEKFVTENWIPVQSLDVDDGSDQWQVQLNATDGSINAFRIDDAGTGYSVADAITVVSRPAGDPPGDAFTGEIAAVGGGGEIQRITITDPGTFYRTPSSADVAIAGGSGAVITPMVSPVGGHGSDAVRELGGFYVMVNVKLQDDEGGAFPTGDDFRIIGILKNPTDNNGTPITANYINTTGLGGAAEIGAGGTDVKADSGQFIYSEFRVPIIRSTTQTEDIKTIIQF